MGPTGVQGVQGVRGSRWYTGARSSRKRSRTSGSKATCTSTKSQATSGAGTKTPKLGSVQGDCCMSWSSETNIKGPKGDKGDPGASGTGTGNVVGPAGATTDNIAVYSDTSGTVIKDGGAKISDLVPVAGLPETIDDRVAALLVAGTNVTLNYNDAANSLTINSAGGGPPRQRQLHWSRAVPVRSVSLPSTRAKTTFIRLVVAAAARSTPRTHHQPEQRPGHCGSRPTPACCSSATTTAPPASG